MGFVVDEPATVPRLLMVRCVGFQEPTVARCSSAFMRGPKESDTFPDGNDGAMGAFRGRCRCRERDLLRNVTSDARTSAVWNATRSMSQYSSKTSVTKDSSVERVDHFIVGQPRSSRTAAHGGVRFGVRSVGYRVNVPSPRLLRSYEIFSLSCAFPAK